MIGEELEGRIAGLIEDQQTRFYGKHRGLVKEVGEGDMLGYIRATVPEIYGEDIDSPWAVAASPFAGKSHGLVLLPEVGDGVWIEFEAGDVSRPIWSGFWWADDEIPDPGGVQTRVLATTAGHKLVLDDDGSEVKLLHSGGAEMTMTDSDITLKVGQSEITMTDSGTTTLKVSSTTKIELSQSGITLEVGAKKIEITTAGVSINNGAINVM
jgi:uncharacterized protein involved in type VI secretion and phage assembly